MPYGVTLPPYSTIHNERIMLCKWGCLSSYATTTSTSLLVFFFLNFFKLGIGLEDDLKVGGRDEGGICFNRVWPLVFF